MLSPMLVRPALTPGLKTPLYVVMRMLALVMFCISFGWAQQSENESVNRSSDASPVQPRTSQAAAPTAPPPTHEMQRLANMLAGRWSVGQAFEPRGGPKGVVGQGTEVWRPGPGARSLIEELQTRVGDREFSGLGVIWWDTQAQGYRVIWCGSANPRGCVVMSKLAHWEGDQFVVGDEFERDGRKVVYREVFSDFTPDSFTQTIYEGESGGELKRTLTIHAAKVPRAAPDDANHPDDEAAIRKLLTDHNAAFNRHDGSGIVYFADDADTRNIVGNFFTGKGEIEELDAALNKSFANVQRTETIQRIRFLTPDIALVDSVADSTGYIVTESGTRLQPGKGGMSFKVVVKKQGRWLIAAMRNATPAPARQALPGSFPGTGIPNPQAQDAPTTSDNTNHAQDEAAIRKKMADGDDAWNRRDAKTFLANARFTENYDHINVQGKWSSGKTQVEKGMTEFFQTHNPASIRRTVERVRFITPEVAVLVVRTTYSKDRRTWDAISTGVSRKVNGEWWGEAFQNTLVKSQKEAVAQAERATTPMAQAEPKVVTPSNSNTDFSSDVAAIRNIVAEGTDAWNGRDAKALVAHISKDNDHVGVTGGWGSGRAQVEEGISRVLATARNKMARSLEKIRFVTSDVAIVIVRTEYTDDKETLKSISTSVFHKMSGEWWNEAFQNTYVWPAETTSPAAPREQDETVAQPATENTRNSPLPNTQSASSPTSTLPRDMIFDNPQIRIRDIKKEPRQKTAIHSVPPLLIVALTPVHNLLTLADGSTKEESITAGDVAWWNGGERGGENLEDKPQEFLTVFPKEPEAGAADVTLPLGELGVQNPEMAHAMIFDNDRFRVSRMSKLPRQPSKLHDAPGRLLVFLTDGHLRCTFPSRPAIDNVAKPGDVAWWPPGMHVSENVGEQEIKFLLIVPKLQNYRPSNP